MEESPDTNPQVLGDEVDELISALEEQRKDHEKSARFLEADTVYQRMLKLKLGQKKTREQNLKEKQEKESTDIEAEYTEELKAFNQDWDTRMEKYKSMCRDSEEQLKAKQSQESEETSKTLEQTIPIIPKHSSEYLNLKRIQDTLVRNKGYKEAHVIQQTMVDLEENKKLTWGEERIVQIQQNLKALCKRQENELNRLIMKAKNGFDELKKQRAAELESLIKKYQNVKKEMKIGHKLEANRLGGLHTTGSGLFKSDFTESARQIFKIKRATSEPAGIKAEGIEAPEVEVA